MAHDAKVRADVRARYVQGMPLTTAAAVAGVSHATARNWKRTAKAAGDDWDILRAARRMSSSGLEGMTSQVLEEMAAQFLATLEAIKASPGMGPAEKANVLAQLSDSYVKTINAASRSNPKLNRLAIAMEIVKDLTTYIAGNFPALHEQFIDVLEAWGPELARKYN